jgi:hypothetical protein
MTEATQQTVDDLSHDVRMICPSGKAAELDAVLKAKVHLPLEAQARFIRRLIDTFESADLVQFQPEPPKTTHNDGSRRRPEKTNPWSKEGWNLTNQSKLVRSIGETKAAAIAEAAGCKLGSTRPNPDYN